MKLFKSKEAYLGFDDRLMVIIGIPVVAILVDSLLFGSPSVTIPSGLFLRCFPIGLIFTSALWLSFREVMCYLVRKYPHDHQIRYRQMLSIAVLTIGYFIIDFIMGITLFRYFEVGHENIPEPDFILKIITSLIFSFLIYGIYEGIYLTHNISKKMMEREQLIKENVKSQLSGLRAQINPHFLFNSLNTLSSLVHEDTNRADQFVLKLAKVYRYMLDQNDEQIVMLSEELLYLDAYKHLLKERFGGNIIFIDHIIPEAMNRYIVPLSLQILFENCVKHNIATSTKPLTISIKVDEAAENIIISNNLQLLHAHIESNGVGLDNIKKRYAIFTKNEILVLKDSNTFSVTLPLLSKSVIKNLL